MSKLSNYINKNNLHHAYLIEGQAEKIVGELFEFLESMGIQTKGNPDFWYQELGTFGIDNAREIKEIQIQKGITDFRNIDISTYRNEIPARKFFIIRAREFTTEAQNALLKIFEDPAPGVHFFIIVPNNTLLLPTLLSRLEKIKGDGSPLAGRSRLAVEFLKSSKDKRLELIKELTQKAESKEDLPGFNEVITRSAQAGQSQIRMEAGKFLDGIEICLREKSKRKSEDDYRGLEELWQCRKYLSARGANPKMLLEHLALVL